VAGGSPISTASRTRAPVHRALETRKAPAVYASFWRRGAALLLDTVLIVAVAIIPLGVLTALGRDFAASALAWAAGSLYFWLTNAFGGTLGKRLLGMRVVDLEGAAPGLTRGFMRSILPNWLGVLVLAGSSSVGIVIAVGAIQLADLLAVFRSPLRQALHDRMAGTYVIRA
jgi:uncharacterized RDD family membrane protein YckC